MAPMQWRDATVGGTDATGCVASRPVAARQEPDVRQVFDQVSSAGFAGQVGSAGEVGMAGQFVVAGSATTLPVGLDLPCTEDPELFFAARAQGALGRLGRRVADARRDRAPQAPSRASA
jgi:hypothetical protein